MKFEAEVLYKRKTGKHKLVFTAPDETFVDPLIILLCEDNYNTSLTFPTISNC